MRGPRSTSPVKVIAAVIADYVNPVNSQKAYHIHKDDEIQDNRSNGVKQTEKANR